MAVGSEDIRFRVLASVVGSQAITGLKGTIEGIGNSTRTLASGLKLLAGGFALKEAGGFLKGIIDTGDQMDALSQRTGISVKDLSAFKTAAEQADLPFEGLIGSLRKFTVNLAGVKIGNEDVKNAFKALGIQATTSGGELRGSGDVLRDLADKFSKMEDGPKKAALAVKLFGKSGVDMIPFLNEGADAISKFGLAIDDDFAARADQFNDTLSLIGVSIKNSAISGLKRIIPTLQELGDAFLRLSESQNDSLGFFDIVGEGARIFANGIVTTFTGAIVAVDTLITGLRQAKAAMTGNFAEMDKIGKGWLERSSKLLLNAKNFVVGTSRNSMLFGEGTSDEIRQRLERETSSTRKKRKGSVDISPLAKDSDLDKELNAARAYAEAGREQIAIDRLKLESYKYSSLELAKMTEAKKIDIEVTKATKNFTSEGTAAYIAAAEAVKEQRLALIELEDQQKQTWSVGARQALSDYAEKARDVAGQVRESFSRAFSNMEDSLVEFAKTGQLNFRKLADDIITDLIRIQVRAIITSFAVSLAGGYAGGGGAGASGGGGATAGASPAVPMTTGKVGGLQTASFASEGTPSSKASGGGPISVTVNVNLDKGTESTSAKNNQAIGRELGQAISSAVKAELIQQKRPGGLLT